MIFDRSSKTYEKPKTMKKYTFGIGLLALLLNLIVVSNLSAQQISMSGTLGYERLGKSVTLSASRIDNFGASGSISGTLALQLWGTNAPYYGGTLGGYKLAEINLGRLFGGNYFGNISQIVNFFEPPTGYYNVTIVLAEWNGYEYLVVDWLNFTNIQNFGGVPPYTPPPSQAPLDLIDEYVGTWEGTQTFQFNGTSYKTTGTSIVTRYQNTGFYSKAYIRTPGKLLAEAEAWQFDNGTMYGIVKSEGIVIGTITGTWYVSGRSIISNVSAVAGNTPYTQNINSLFTDSGTIVSTTTTSYGGFGSGTLKKVSTFSSPTSAPNPPNMGGAPVSPASGGQVQSPKKGKKAPAKAKKSGSKKKPAAKKAKKR